MRPGTQVPPARPPGFRPAVAGLLLLLGCAVLLSAPGCLGPSGTRSPGRTTVQPKAALLPARIVSNFFLVEAKQADGHTYRFLIDTGSRATLVSAALAHSLRTKDKAGSPGMVRLSGAMADELELEAATLKSLRLGDATFEQVSVLIYDFTEFSGQLGLPLDGVIGFPIFRDTVLTLDYPGARLMLAPPGAEAGRPAPVPGTTTVACNNEDSSPLIPVQLGNESFIALLDSGSDGGLSLNPTGLHPRFASGPRAGVMVSSLGGDHQQRVGRLSQDLLVGSIRLEQPVTDLTDQLSSLGGEFLKHFTVTFDQRNSRVTFRRGDGAPVRMASRRNTGLSFSRTPVYWRVLAVVPDTPAARTPVQTGDLCVRINGEPVEKWGAERYAALLRTAPEITYTFLQGPKETELKVPVIDLVP